MIVTIHRVAIYFLYISAIFSLLLIFFSISGYWQDVPLSFTGENYPIPGNSSLIPIPKYIFLIHSSSSIHSINHLLICSFILSLIQSFRHVVIHSFSDSFTHSSIHLGNSVPKGAEQGDAERRRQLDHHLHRQGRLRAFSYKILSWIYWSDCLMHTVCLRSSDLFYIVSYYIKLVTTSWTHSTV